MKRTTQPPAPPRTINPTISRSLEYVVLRSLAIHPADRYETAEDFITALKKAAASDADEKSGLGSLGRKTIDFTLPAFSRLASEKNSFAAKLSKLWRHPVWLAAAGISIVAIALSVSGGSAFRSAASQLTPTPTLAPTATYTPELTPTPTPTNTPTVTDSSVLAAPTNSLLSLLRPTSTPAPVLPPGSLTATATATPTSSVLDGILILRKPLSLEEPSYGPTEFEWQWTGQKLPPEFGFEVRVWREGELPAGAHDAVLDNQQGRIESIGQHTYRLSINIRNAYGVRERTGKYLWTVALVRVSPAYADLGRQAEPAHLRFEAGGSGRNRDSEGGGVRIE